jgi:hypothetical protein
MLMIVFGWGKSTAVAVAVGARQVERAHKIRFDERSSGQNA